MADTKLVNMASYLSEICLLDLKMYRWKASLIATACIFLAKHVLKRPEPWCATMQEESKYTEI